LIEGLIKLFFTERIYEPINLGNPNPINMKELAEEILELTGSDSNLSYKELPGDDPKQREPNITKAEDLLNWKPVVERVNGLSSTIGFFKAKL
jgi:nucleoside-diphosphate-sugar epimerase